MSRQEGEGEHLLATTFQRTITAEVPVDAIPSYQPVLCRITQALREKSRLLVTFVNPSTTVLLRRDRSAGLFDQFDVVAPDGIAMAIAVRWLYHVPAARISFDSTSLAPDVFRLAVAHQARVVLCGGRPGVAEQAQQQLQAAFPGLQIVKVYDGYAERSTTIEAIRQLAPEIVICGMGGLVQERFLLSLTNSGWCGVGFTCGGYLDQLSKGLEYYPTIIDRLNLRWAYRLFKEPRRLWRRYLLDYPVFAISVGKALLSSSRTHDQH